MKKNKRITVVIYMALYIAITVTGCIGNRDDDLNRLYKNSKEQIEEQNAENKQNEVNSEESADNEIMQDALGDMNYPYYYLDVNNPAVQEHIVNGDVWFMSRVFIKGLIGYTPQSDISGMLAGYIKDTEIIIRGNQGLFQSERLAEVKEYILNIMMDIVRERGKNTEEYQEYFAEEAMLQQMKDYLNSELEEDWLLLESFYLSYYAGNAEEIPWYSDSETVWENEENGVTHRMTETESSYCFEFLFYADYKTMEYGEKDKAAALAINCALSKETGLIEEIAISKWYISREDFETSRW